MMQVLVTLPEVTITKKGWKKETSIYTLSLASDLSGQAQTNPQALKDLGLDITDENVINATKYVNLGVSPPFENITPDQPLPIIGDGIILYRYSFYGHLSHDQRSRLGTGTVGSGKESTQNVPGRVDIRRVGVTTGPTPEHLRTQPVSLLSVTTA